MIKLQAKRFEVNFLLKFSDLKSNFTLTLGYLNPALNNWGLAYRNSEMFRRTFKSLSNQKYAHLTVSTRIFAAIFAIGVLSSRQPWKHLHIRSRLFVPHSQPASQSKMAPNASNRMALRSIPLGLVHKTLESDFRKNDTISMRSPSSNAITTVKHPLQSFFFIKETV